ncbi:MAG TPA: anaerobic sulfite reductase subunit AsrA [Candidatus Blautia pullicola]|jgi:anaerobic sulfite reductase subunit A|uniref:Anaerobic sulfite reductase subunit AsrA n=1 Tax=Candidatus Blautia pullicola TaxID=2838498 RepID=A0A9D2JSS7_9FIRM|nr:anaerobic sulfite reductase subunit AsrA [Candidatus Blautia pullicola]
MGNLWNKEALERLLENLSKDYDIFAPKLYPGTGCSSDTDVVRYGAITSFDEIVWEQKSDYSFKEALLPVSDTVLYFTESTAKLPEAPKKRLIFLRACELNALRRLDEIYLHNGPEDYYYKRVREEAKFILMGCSHSFESCFCVSMGTNQAQGYDGYAHLSAQGLYLDLTDAQLASYADNISVPQASEEIQYVTQNEEQVPIPRQLPHDIASHPVWQEYSGRCIGCGRCNFVCPTCTCFSMQDIFYKDNPQAGERRRVWASCQVDGYSDIAGGISFRKDQGERMRFKVLHKVYNYKNRFGYHMCVGCGRCENVCPEYISYIECLNKLSEIGGTENE